MTGRTHDLAAITALMVVVVQRPTATMTLSTIVAAIFANLIGGVTPDIDQPTAPLWNNLPGVGRVMGRLFNLMTGGHRFLTHSFIGLALVGFLGRMFLEFVQPIVPSVDIGLVWWAFMIGVASHIVMDLFTKEGVPLLLPIPIKFGIPPAKRLRIVTGKRAEVWLVYPSFVIFNAVYIARNHAEIIDIFRSYIV